jgi:hypothetical protein
LRALVLTEFQVRENVGVEERGDEQHYDEEQY